VNSLGIDGRFKKSFAVFFTAKADEMQQLSLPKKCSKGTMGRA
jgi:hypothetical protein